MSMMAENVIATRADNRPSMLEKSQYNTWQSRMKLYIRGKEHGKDILNSVLNGPFKYGTVEVPGTPTTVAYMRERTYEDLTDKEKIHKECDIRATNIVLQGLPPDVYTLVNHHTVAKEIWYRVKLLIKGNELSPQERESKLYNEFDRMKNSSKSIEFKTAKDKKQLLLLLLLFNTASVKKQLLLLVGIAKVDIGPCDVGLYGKVMVLFDGAEVEVKGTMNSSGGKFRIRFEDNGVNPLFSLSVCIVSPFGLMVQGSKD
ncbi:hypothetical protein Tco_0753321 [Tanacetum coccineum]